LKRVLIISPYFPPANAADMHRVRTSLPYFKALGWEAEVVMVARDYTDVAQDELLLQNVPPDITIHKVNAFDKKWTSKMGLGSIALRSLWFYKHYVDKLLANKHFDLIYLSTTQFPVLVLGAHWKKKFGIPYVIDMQDPWHSEYYQNKPKAERPKKYWFSYRLNKWLEPIALKEANGLISVSESYISDLKVRYPVIKNIPAATITFGFFEPDLPIAVKNIQRFENILDANSVNIVYIGRGGADMNKALKPLFASLKKGLTEQPEVFVRLKVYFIGTSYAPAGQGKPTILPLAAEYGVQNNVVEITDRISFYHALSTLHQADALFVPGSDDPKYTASKIYPYLLTRKPLMAIFHSNSTAVDVLNNCTKNAIVLTLADEQVQQEDTIYQILYKWANREFTGTELTDNIEEFNARNLTARQVALFEQAIDNFNGR